MHILIELRYKSDGPVFDPGLNLNCHQGIWTLGGKHTYKMHKPCCLGPAYNPQ